MIKTAFLYPLLLGCTCMLYPAYSVSAQSESTADGKAAPSAWLSIDRCPVLVEQSVDVPALESGVLDQLSIRANQAVEQGAIIARLDAELALVDVRLTQLQLDVAQELASDRSDIDFHRIALQQMQEELDGFQKISKSVSNSEIRRLKLGVEQAKLALIRSQQAQQRAALDVQLKSANVDAAKKRAGRRAVRSPIAGVASTVFKHQGQWVEAGEPVARVEAFDRLIVDSLIPLVKLDLQAVVGAEVEAISQQSGRAIRLRGHVLSYDHKVSGQGLVRVHSRINNVQKNGQWVLLPGMTVELRIAKRHGATERISAVQSNANRSLQ